MRKFVKLEMKKALPLLAAGMILAGCVTDDLAMDDTYVPLTPSERYPIEYAKGPMTLQVATNHGTLQPAQVNVVAGFARQSMAGGATPVTIRRPAGGGASKRVAQEIAGLLLQQGVPREMIKMTTYPAPASAPVQLAYLKSYAHTKPCGTWDVNVADTAQNHTMTNHGCAVQANIAAMIADPEDIVTPNPVSPTPATASTKAIRRLYEPSATSSSSGI